MSGYTIRPAGPGDLNALLNLRTEAEQWLRVRGVTQWTPEFREYGKRVISANVGDGSAWVVESGGVAATVTLGGPDLDFWTPEDAPESALHVMKMIVARAHAGRDLGGAILNWASVRAYVGGYRWLRLDCNRDNPALHRYYLDRGFRHVRTVLPPPRRTLSGALFERRAGLLTDCPIMLDEVAQRAA